MKQAPIRSGAYVFTYMDGSMNPAQVDAVRAPLASKYRHHTVAILFNNGSFFGGSEAVYEIIEKLQVARCTGTPHR